MSYSAETFKHLNPKGNMMLSKLSQTDLQELLILLENYYLTLRKSLNIDNSLTFGFEIEYKYNQKEINNNDINKLLRSFDSKKRQWRGHMDASIHYGGEISSPILKDRTVYWKELEYVCSLLKSVSIVDDDCGGHIHIGAQILGTKKENWLNFIYLCAVYENIIYRFGYGEFLTERSRIKKYAPPLSKQLLIGYSKYKNKDCEFYNLINHFITKRYSAINFSYIEKNGLFEEENTIEFRTPNGTLEPIIWQNNLNLFSHLLMYSKDNNFDRDIIKKRYMCVRKSLSRLKCYREVYLEQALELGDMIFDNNIDKIYFLKQYLKSFEVGREPLEKAKTFILEK